MDRDSARCRRRRATRDGRAAITTPSRSPTPSPSESWNERGYTWYSTPCFHQIHPSLAPIAPVTLPAVATSARRCRPGADGRWVGTSHGDASGSMPRTSSSAPGAAADAVVAAEAAGFEAAMCSDHLAPWSERQGHSGHAWSWLGAALQATDLSFGRRHRAGAALPPGRDRAGDRHAGRDVPRTVLGRARFGRGRSTST